MRTFKLFLLLSLLANINRVFAYISIECRNTGRVFNENGVDVLKSHFQIPEGILTQTNEAYVCDGGANPGSKPKSSQIKLYDFWKDYHFTSLEQQVSLTSAVHGDANINSWISAQYVADSDYLVINVLDATSANAYLDFTVRYEGFREPVGQCSDDNPSVNVQGSTNTYSQLMTINRGADPLVRVKVPGNRLFDTNRVLECHQDADTWYHDGGAIPGESTYPIPNIVDPNDCEQLCKDNLLCEQYIHHNWDNNCYLQQKFFSGPIGAQVGATSGYCTETNHKYLPYRYQTFCGPNEVHNVFDYCKFDATQEITITDVDEVPIVGGCDSFCAIPNACDVNNANDLAAQTLHVKKIYESAPDDNVYDFQYTSSLEASYTEGNEFFEIKVVYTRQQGTIRPEGIPVTEPLNCERIGLEITKNSGSTVPLIPEVDKYFRDSNNQQIYKQDCDTSVQTDANGDYILIEHDYKFHLAYLLDNVDFTVVEYENARVFEQGDCSNIFIDPTDSTKACPGTYWYDVVGDDLQTCLDVCDIHDDCAGVQYFQLSAGQHCFLLKDVVNHKVSLSPEQDGRVYRKNKQRSFTLPLKLTGMLMSNDLNWDNLLGPVSDHDFLDFTGTIPDTIFTQVTSQNERFTVVHDVRLTVDIRDHSQETLTYCSIDQSSIILDVDLDIMDLDLATITLIEFDDIYLDNTQVDGSGTFHVSSDSTVGVLLQANLVSTTPVTITEDGVTKNIITIQYKSGCFDANVEDGEKCRLNNLDRLYQSVNYIPVKYKSSVDYDGIIDSVMVGPLSGLDCYNGLEDRVFTKCVEVFWDLTCTNKFIPYINSKGIYVQDQFTTAASAIVDYWLFANPSGTGPLFEAVELREAMKIADTDPSVFANAGVGQFAGIELICNRPQADSAVKRLSGRIDPLEATQCNDKFIKDVSGLYSLELTKGADLPAHNFPEDPLVFDLQLELVPFAVQSLRIESLTPYDDFVDFTITDQQYINSGFFNPFVSKCVNNQGTTYEFPPVPQNIIDICPDNGSAFSNECIAELWNFICKEGSTIPFAHLNSWMYTGNPDGNGDPFLGIQDILYKELDNTFSNNKGFIYQNSCDVIDKVPVHSYELYNEANDPWRVTHCDINKNGQIIGGEEIFEDRFFIAPSLLEGLLTKESSFKVSVIAELHPDWRLTSSGRRMLRQMGIDTRSLSEDEKLLVTAEWVNKILPGDPFDPDQDNRASALIWALIVPLLVVGWVPVLVCILYICSTNFKQFYNKYVCKCGKESTWNKPMWKSLFVMIHIFLSFAFVVWGLTLYAEHDLDDEKFGLAVFSLINTTWFIASVTTALKMFFYMKRNQRLTRI